jgi:hypothetical protein
MDSVQSGLKLIVYVPLAVAFHATPSMRVTN